MKYFSMNLPMDILYLFVEVHTFLSSMDMIDAAMYMLIGAGVVRLMAILTLILSTLMLVVLD